MQQGSSVTEQLVYRTSYRKHREKLVDIRHNAMLHNFLQHSKPRLEDKKGQLRNKIKNEEITNDNKILKMKINSINKRNFHEGGLPFSTEEMRVPTKRYDSNNNNDDEGCRFQIQSDFDDDDNEPVKCILPGKNGRAFSFASNQKNKYPRTQKRNSLRNNFTSSERSDKKFESFNMTRQNIHQLLILQEKQPQIEFNLLERNQNRKVVYKKTIILSPMQSALFELSLISGRLLVVAYLMGIENYRIREFFSEKKTRKITKDCKENYEELCSRITLEKINDKYGMIKISMKDSEAQNQKKVSIEQDVNKNKVKLQSEFIKRNYYTLLKKQKQEQPKQEVGKEKAHASIEKVQALVERLAIPRKYPKEQNVPIGTLTKKGDSINSRVMSKPVIPPIIRQQFQPVKERKQAVLNKDLPPTLSENKNATKTQQRQKQKQVHPQKDKQKINQLINLEYNDYKNNNDEYKQSFQQEEDEQVQYLGDGNDEYAESFQNPSGLKNHSQIKQISQQKSINNNSSMMKHKQEAIVQEKNRSDMYQDIYEQESEKAKEEQNYEQQFEESKEKNEPIVKNKKQVINKEVVEEDYQQEFDN